MDGFNFEEIEHRRIEVEKEKKEKLYEGLPDFVIQKIENGNFVKITEISSMNDEPLAYVATYIIPIIFNDYSNLADNVTIVCIFYVVYRLYIRSKLILVNPILSMKYSIFNIKFNDGAVSRQGILISKDKFIEEEDMAKIYNVGFQLYYGYKK